jgi:hypothetical protein
MSLAQATLTGQSADDDARSRALTRINLQDLLDNFGLAQVRWLRPALERLLWSQASQFTRLVMDFDRRIGEAELQSASREFLARHTRGLHIIGLENAPMKGAVIFAANHAGMSESLACFSAIPRRDLRVVANDRPFVRALPNMFARLIAVPEAAGDRFAVVRQVTRHLNSGGALFINPAGRIEPDPACMPGAVESLRVWSPSLGVFIKRAPAVCVVPTLVSGVILPWTLRHPLVRLRRRRQDRERAAAAIQLMVHLRQRERTPVTPTVRFGRPLHGEDLAQLGSAQEIVAAITAAMADMMLGL